MKILIAIFAATLLSLSTLGCGSSSTEHVVTNATPVSFDSGKYLLADEPDGAVGVIAARQSANDGEPIVMVGRVGGSTNPWIDGRAAFMMLDASKSVVATGTESKGGNEICMGDCCALERAACTALVTFVDEHGSVIPVDSRKLLQIAENDMLLVQGKVKKDDTGNFTVLASKVYVRR